jgi:hypothetical protein
MQFESFALKLDQELKPAMRRFREKIHKEYIPDFLKISADPYGTSTLRPEKGVDAIPVDGENEGITGWFEELDEEARLHEEDKRKRWEEIKRRKKSLSSNSERV